MKFKNLTQLFNPRIEGALDFIIEYMISHDFFYLMLILITKS